MKIQPVSDLHLEFPVYHLCETINACESDVLVIAGDLHTSKGIIQALHNLAKFKKHIVFVPGNHEYYYSTKHYVDEQLKVFDGHKYIHVLNNSVWEYNGVVFLGSTGWWTMNNAFDAVKYMSDYDVIHDIKQAKNGLDWGCECREFFRANLQKYDKRDTWRNPPECRNKKVVCVSHNAPSLQSIDEEFKNSPLNPCFTNTWEYLIFTGKPDLWIHGHMHGSKDYMLEDTRIICNPHGYNDVKTNDNFKPNLVVEV